MKVGTLLTWQSTLEEATWKLQVEEEVDRMMYRGGGVVGGVGGVDGAPPFGEEEDLGVGWGGRAWCGLGIQSSEATWGVCSGLSLL